MGKGTRINAGDLQSNRKFSETGNICVDESDSTCSADLWSRHRIKSNFLDFAFKVRYRTSAAVSNFQVAANGFELADGTGGSTSGRATVVNLPNTVGEWNNLDLQVIMSFNPLVALGYWAFSFGLRSDSVGGSVDVESVFVNVINQSIIENAGTPVQPRKTINFTGAGVSVADTAEKTTVTIAGGGGSSSPKLCVAFQSNAGTTAALTDQANAEQFLTNSNRNIKLVDLTDFTQYRLYARITTGSASANTPRLYVQYNATFSTTPGDYSPLGASGDVNLSLTTAGGIVTAWTNIATAAKADVFLAVMQDGGDAAADPAFGQIEVQFR